MASTNEKKTGFRYTFNEIIRFHRTNVVCYRELCEKNSNIIPFIGTGVSAAFGCGSWGGLLKSILENVKLRINIEDEKKIADKIENEEYMSAADILLNALTNDGKEIMYWNALKMALNLYNRTEFEFSPEDSVYWIPLLGSGYCVTTNYDCILEKAAEKRGYPYTKVYDHRNFSMPEKGKEKEQILYKIHGNIDTDLEEVDPAKPLFLLAKKHYKIVYGNLDGDGEKTELVRNLSDWADEFTFLFIGSSLSEKMIAAAIGLFVKKEKLHYALLAENSRELIGEKLHKFHFVQEFLYPKDENDTVHSSLVTVLHQFRRDTACVIWNTAQKWEVKAMQIRKEIKGEWLKDKKMKAFFSDKFGVEILMPPAEMQDMMIEAANDFFVWPQWSICKLNTFLLVNSDFKLEDYFDYLPLGNSLYIIDYCSENLNADSFPAECEAICETIKCWYKKNSGSFSKGIGIRIMLCGLTSDNMQKSIQFVKNWLMDICPLKTHKMLADVYAKALEVLSLTLLWRMVFKMADIMPEQQRLDILKYIFSNINSKNDNNEKVIEKIMKREVDND